MGVRFIKMSEKEFEERFGEKTPQKVKDIYIDEDKLIFVYEESSIVDNNEKIWYNIDIKENGKGVLL